MAEANKVELIIALKDQVTKKYNEIVKTIGTGYKSITGHYDAVKKLVTEMINATKALAVYAQGLEKLAGRLDLSIADTQRYMYVLERLGVEAGTASGLFRTLNETIEKAHDPTSDTAEAMEKLGITYAEMMTMSDTQRVYRVVGILSQIEDKTERTYRAQELLGDSYQTYLDMAEQAEGLGDLSEVGMQADRWALSEDQVDTLDNFKETWDDLQHIIQGATADALVPFSDDLSALLVQVGEFVESAIPLGQQLLGSFLPVITSVIQLGTEVNELGGGLADLFALSADGWVMIIDLFTEYDSYQREAVGELEEFANTLEDDVAGGTKSVAQAMADMNRETNLIIGSYGVFATASREASEAQREFTEAIIDTVSEPMVGLDNILTQYYMGFIDETEFQNMFDMYIANTESSLNELQDMYDVAQSNRSSVVGIVSQEIIDFLEDNMGGFQAFANQATEVMVDQLHTYKDELDSTARSLTIAISSYETSTILKFGLKPQELRNLETLLESINTKRGVLDQIEATMVGSISMLGSANTIIENTGETLTEFQFSTSDTVISILSDLNTVGTELQAGVLDHSITVQEASDLYATAVQGMIERFIALKEVATWTPFVDDIDAMIENLQESITTLNNLLPTLWERDSSSSGIDTELQAFENSIDAIEGKIRQLQQSRMNERELALAQHAVEIEALDLLAEKAVLMGDANDLAEIANYRAELGLQLASDLADIEATALTNANTYITASETAHLSEAEALEREYDLKVEILVADLELLESQEDRLRVGEAIRVLNEDLQVALQDLSEADRVEALEYANEVIAERRESLMNEVQILAEEYAINQQNLYTTLSQTENLQDRQTILQALYDLELTYHEAVDDKIDAQAETISTQYFPYLENFFNAFRDGKDAMQQFFIALRNEILRTVAMEAFKALIKLVLAWVTSGGSTIGEATAGAVTAPQFMGYQTGGYVPDVGEFGDLHPALLERGELVLPRDMVNRMKQGDSISKSSNINITLASTFSSASKTEMLESANLIVKCLRERGVTVE